MNCPNSNNSKSKSYFYLKKKIRKKGHDDRIHLFHIYWLAIYSD